MPVPSASSKIIFTTFKFFWACSIFFEHSQFFWSWSKTRFYLINFHIWAWSKIFEHIQNILNTVKNIWLWSKNIWTSRWIRHETSNSGYLLIFWISLNCAKFQQDWTTVMKNLEISHRLTYVWWLCTGQICQIYAFHFIAEWDLQYFFNLL